MTYEEACKLSLETGCFITHKFFDNDQSLHVYSDGKIYFEDGAILIDTYFKNHYPDGYSVKATKDKIDQNKLKEYHDLQNQRNLMIEHYNKSYNDCIIRKNA